jgi:hypothetical protein
VNIEDLPEPERSQVETMTCPGCRRPRRESMITKLDYVPLLQVSVVASRCVKCGSLIRFSVPMPDPPKSEIAPAPAQSKVETPQWAKDLFPEDHPPESK